MIWLIIAIFAAWGIVLYIAKKKGEKYGFDLMGPLLMWKTEKGKKFIDRISRKRIWKHYGNAAIIICIVAMFFTTLLIIWNVIIAFSIPPEAAPSPRLILGIPGINPIIPIGYGILALAIAIIVHEFSHGILARFGKIKVNSLGLLFLIFPVGAFVEPDEEELKNTSRMKRSRVFAAGPASNIILALICILLLGFILAPLITPKADGVIVAGDGYGLEKWGIITELNGVKISDKKEFTNVTHILQPGKFYNITLVYGENVTQKRFLHGIYVAAVVEKSPAKNVLEVGSIIYRINDVLMGSRECFFKFMNSTHAGDEIIIEFYYNGSFFNKTVTLADKYDFIRIGENKGKGFLGVEAYGIQDIVVDANYFPKVYNPFKGRFLPYLALPFTGLSPPPKELANLYTPSPLFWKVYNILYWIFWLNFAIGTFNALPSVPLDGGYIFKDGMSYVISKFRVKRERAEKISAILTNAISIIMFLCIFSIIIVPRLRGFISF